MSKTVLITGIAGFLGSHVAEECLRRGYTVWGIDDLSGGDPLNIPQGVKDWAYKSILRADGVDYVFEVAKPDYVFHLAAYAAEGLSHFIRAFNYRNNVEGSMNVINACVKHEVKCLVFTSSIAIYGRETEDVANSVLYPFAEWMTPKPIDPYGIAKYAVELDLAAAREMFGLNSVVFRPHNVFGERQNLSDGYRNVVGIFMRQCLQGKPMTIFGDGNQIRQFTYVRNIVGAMVDAIDPERSNLHGQAFNVGGDSAFTVNHLAGEVARALGVEDRREHLPPRHEVVHAACDHDKAKRFFGENSMSVTPLGDGLARMAAWAKTQTLREPKKFEHIEITKNLPPSWA